MNDVHLLIFQSNHHYTQQKLHYIKYLIIYILQYPSISCQLILLDLPCAFDSLSHLVLISRLEMISIRGTVLKCFSSYILNRSLSVKICNLSTQSRPLLYGVPQVSVLGPSSSQYTSSLYMILLVNFQMSTIKFTQMIFNYIPSYPTHKCASTIRSWFLYNNLLLNSSKSALLNIQSNYRYVPHHPCYHNIILSIYSSSCS